jgi:cysteinyl-tRNA synthetase
MLAALEDDLNTPLAIAQMHELATELNKATNDQAHGKGPSKEVLKAKLLAAGRLIGHLQDDPESWLRRPRNYVLKAEAGTFGVKGGGVNIPVPLAEIKLRSYAPQVSAEEVDDLIAKRIEAKKAHDFAEADRIRDELNEKGIVLEDKPGGKTDWRRAG